MEESQNKGMSLFAKISIVLNTLLFGITGVIYLLADKMMIGYVLLGAGVVNILYSLFTVKTKNYFFVGLNFIFAAVSLWVCIDFLLDNNNTTSLLWMIITLVYLILGFVLLMKVKNAKQS